MIDKIQEFLSIGDWVKQPRDYHWAKVVWINGPRSHLEIEYMLGVRTSISITDIKHWRKVSR